MLSKAISVFKTNSVNKTGTDPSFLTFTVAFRAFS